MYDMPRPEMTSGFCTAALQAERPGHCVPGDTAGEAAAQGRRICRRQGFLLTYKLLLATAVSRGRNTEFKLHKGWLRLKTGGDVWPVSSTKDTD